MKWLLLPIRDVDVPDSLFEKKWVSEGKKLRALLTEGRNVLVHCRGGLGRSGTIAARLLIERGMEPDKAISLVRKHRPGAIETSKQEDYVRKQKPIRERPKSSPPISCQSDRAIGCLVGLAIGDALGTTLEFGARDALPPVTDIVGGGPFKLEAGEWTDDTSMALCLADSLLACRGLEPADLLARFQRWREAGHNSVNGVCFDIGIATGQAISRFARDGNPLAGSTDPNSAGNGSIMRLAPIPIFFADDEAEAEAAAVLQSRTTHAAQECLDACVLMARIIHRLINGVTWERSISGGGADIKSPKIKALAAGKWTGAKRSQIKSTGYVVDTLEAALWAVHTTTSFSDAVLLAVNLGGDADTVGAVTGQLAGARYGYRQIPTNWMTRLAWSEHIIEVARSLCGGAGKKH